MRDRPYDKTPTQDAVAALAVTVLASAPARLRGRGPSDPGAFAAPDSVPASLSSARYGPAARKRTDRSS